MTNPYRKCQNFHLTYLGHYILTIPFEYDFLAVCHEIGRKTLQVHTHIVLKTTDKISKHQLIEETRPYVIEGHLRVDPHPRIETAIGYHCGMGDKEACPEFTVLDNPDFSINEWKKAKCAHKKFTLGICRERNRIILNEKSGDLVDQGVIPVEKLKLIDANKEHYRSKYGKDTRAPIPVFIPNTWGKVLQVNMANKKRHFWIWSKDYSKGKTTNRKLWCKNYRFEHNPYDDGRWLSLHHQTEGIIFDPYAGKDSRLSHDKLEELTDGEGCRINVKGGEIYKLPKDLLIIIMCNDSIKEAYPHQYEKISKRFIEIEV